LASVRGGILGSQQFRKRQARHPGDVGFQDTASAQNSQPFTNSGIQFRKSMAPMA